MLDGESGESVGVSSLEELCSKRDGNGGIVILCNLVHPQPRRQLPRYISARHRPR
jgi:hypothetical protein